MISARVPSSQLYLILNSSDDGQKLFECAHPCHRLGGRSALLLECSKKPPPSHAALCKTVSSLRALGIAKLVESDATLAKTLKADGAHLAPTKNVPEKYASAQNKLGIRFIIGADTGVSRHDATCLGEEGADYIAFGKKGKRKKEIQNLNCNVNLSRGGLTSLRFHVLL